LFNVESGMANQYILDLSKNVKRGILTKLEKGGWPNLAPLGYLNDGKGGIIQDKERIKYIKKIIYFVTIKVMWVLKKLPSYYLHKALEVVEIINIIKVKFTKYFPILFIAE